MTRRFPLLIGVAGLAAIGATYVALAHRVVGAATESWYQLVERRMAVDRAALIPAEGTRWFGMYRPELPWRAAAMKAVDDRLNASAIGSPARYEEQRRA